MYKRGLVEGLKKLMRKGEITKTYQHQPGFQGGQHFNKPALTPNMGAKPAALTANTPKAKLKLADSRKRAGVTGSNPTIRAHAGDKKGIADAVKNYRNDRTAHNAAKGKKKVVGKKETGTSKLAARVAHYKSNKAQGLTARRAGQTVGNDGNYTMQRNKIPRRQDHKGGRRD